MLQNGNCWTVVATRRSSSSQTRKLQEAKTRNNFFISSVCCLSAHPIRITCTCAFFMFVCVRVCVCVWESERVCVGRSFLHLLVGCFLCRCQRAAPGFVLHGSRALSLDLPLLRPRPLLPLLLPSYSCVAFFLTFAEFIDIFSICFCSLLSLSERALSLFLPLSLSLFPLLSFVHSISLTHTHTNTCFFFCFL